MPTAKAGIRCDTLFRQGHFLYSIIVERNVTLLAELCRSHLKLLFEGGGELAHLAKAKLSGYFRQCLVGVQEKIPRLIDLERKKIRVRCVLCIALEQVMEMGGAVADVCRHIVDRNVFVQMLTHIADRLKKCALVGEGGWRQLLLAGGL